MNGFLVFIIILLCSIALGFLILCITGIDIVGKNRVYVVEKLGIFNKLLTTGIHFNFPLIYQIVGKYNVNIIKAQNKINDYEIEVGREETIWRENMQKFKTKDLLEANLYMKDTFQHIRNKIAKNKVSIKEVFGINGKIFYYD